MTSFLIQSFASDSFVGLKLTVPSFLCYDRITYLSFSEWDKVEGGKTLYFITEFFSFSKARL